ncbi:MAG: LysR family transcriptional regulator [Myxococcota bacterium]
MKIHEMELLVRVAEAGSMTKAARQLHLTPAAVSAAVGRIEEALGVRLFERTTRAMHPTEEGLVVLDGCRDVITRWQHTLEEVQGARGPAGTVHLSAPADTSYQVVGPVLAGLAEAHPELRAVVHVGDDVQHLHRDAIDMAIRYGALPDSSLRARRLASTPSMLVAAPAYLAAAGTPTHADDLHAHRLLTLHVASAPATQWVLFEGETRHEVTVQSPLCGDGLLARRWALEGRGIARKSLLDVIDDLERGALVRVLPHCRGEATPIHAVFPSRRYLPSRVRVVDDALEKAFAERSARCEAWLEARPR